MVHIVRRVFPAVLLFAMVVLGVLAGPGGSASAAPPAAVVGAPVVATVPGWPGFLHPSVTLSSSTDRSAALIAFTCTADSAVTWAMSVSGGDGAVVRTFPIIQGACGTGQDYDVSVNWDGRSDTGADLPDGDYVATAIATDSSGLSGTAELSVVVETRSLGVISSPLAGASLSGTVDLVFTPATDLEIQEIYFQLPNCVFWVHTVDPDGSMTAHQADIGTCAGGEQLLVAEVHWLDAFGLTHVYTTDPVAVLVEDNAAPLVARNLNGQPRDSVVALTAPGQRSTVRLEFSCADGSDVAWDFTIRNTGDEIVRSFPPKDDLCQDWIDQTNPEIYWDGTDDAGADLPDGEYRLRATVTDAFGRTGMLDEPLFVQAAAPGVPTSPAAGSTQTGSLSYQLVQAAGFPQLNYVDFRLQALAEPGLPPVVGRAETASPDGVFRLTQSLAGVATGPAGVAWDAEWTDQFGADHYFLAATSAFTIGQAPVLAGVVSGVGGPLQGAKVTIYDCRGRAIASAVTGADGRYTFPTLRTDRIKIKIAAHGYRNWYYNGKHSLRAATVVTIAAGKSLSVDATLRKR